jgi:hypothetical protein
MHERLSCRRAGVRSVNYLAEAALTESFQLS